MTTRPLFLMHIPKTAGISAGQMISPRFPAGRTSARNTREFAGDPDDFDFIAAHLGFGFVARFRRPPVVMTFLREPVERALSRWRYAQEIPPRRVPREHVRDSAAVEFNRLARELPLVELLEREPAVAKPFLSNLQTAYLSGRDDDGTRPAPPVLRYERLEMPTEAAELEEAKRNLERCDVIGFTEEFDASMERLARRLGWPGFGRARRANVSKVSRDAAAVPPRAFEILAEWNALDRDLYAHARRLMAEGRAPERPAPPAPLPAARGYRFDQPIHGAGWHERERDALGWFCWAGAEEEAVLYLAAPRAATDQRLLLRLAHVIHPDALADLRVSVNGRPLPLTLRDGRGPPLAEVEVGRHVLAADGDRLRIGIKTSLWLRPCDINPASTDTRCLSIALREIDLVPR